MSKLDELANEIELAVGLTAEGPVDTYQDRCKTSTIIRGCIKSAYILGQEKTEDELLNQINLIRRLLDLFGGGNPPTPASTIKEAMRVVEEYKAKGGK